VDNHGTLGYFENPKNGSEITRAWTTGQLRLWKIPNSRKALEIVHKEFGHQDFPGIYILFDRQKVYIGEAKSIYNRLLQHHENPDAKIKQWNQTIIINDGRIATQSLFNDTVVRRSLENHLNTLLKTNKYNVVSQASPQIANPSQQPIINLLQREIDYVLIKQNVITKLLAEGGQQEIHLDELKKILDSKRYEIDESAWSAYEAVVNRVKVFIRPGSEKKKGWQVTFRDRFKKALEEEEGSLLMPRDGILLIPFSEIKKAIKDPNAFGQNTIDIYIEFQSEGKALLWYKQTSIDVTSFKVVN